MLLTDVWMLDGFLAQHPPVDLLVASYLGYKAPGSPCTLREAKRENTKASQALGKPRRKLSQMPAYIRDSPATQKTIEKIKAEWQTS